MLTIDYGGRFKKDVRRLEKRGKKLDKLWQVVERLCREQPLPPKHRNHRLTGNWSGFMECHIEPDWLACLPCHR